MLCNIIELYMRRIMQLISINDQSQQLLHALPFSKCVDSRLRGLVESHGNVDQCLTRWRMRRRRNQFIHSTFENV